MTVTFPTLRVGEPLRHRLLAIFPLFSEPDNRVVYRLSTEALADQSATVEEISEAGSVPDLLVKNKGDIRVLFLEGEELVGAKQNRILNCSVLVAARSTIKIPVSCVERGRWRYKSKYFALSESSSPYKLRRALKMSVSESLRAQQGHGSNQSEVWKEVASLHALYDVRSDTGAMSDAFDSYQTTIAEYQAQLKYVAGATGMAVAVGQRLLALEVFDKPGTCKQVWDRLLSSYVFDALAPEPVDVQVTASGVEQFLTAMTASNWEAVAAVGEGEDYRAVSTTGGHASALICDGALVHGSMLAGG